MKQKGFAPVLIILLVLLTIGGIFYLGKRKVNLSLPLLVSTQNQNIFTTESSAQLSQTSSPTSGTAKTEKCPTTPNASYSKEVSISGTMCKFTMFKEYNNPDFTVTYPQEWMSSIVGAAGINIRFEKSDKEFVYLLQTVTNMQIQNLDRAEICYEGCNKIVENNEIEISKTVETDNGIQVLRLITAVGNKKMERLFYLTDRKYESEFRLFVFQFSPTTTVFENEVIDLLKSLKFAQ